MNDKHLYNYATVKLQFRDRVYGGIPKTRELIDNYVSGKFGVAQGDLAEKLKEEVDLLEETEKVTTGFKSKDGKPYISDYQVKALLKQAANRLKITKKKRGSKQDITDGLFMSPEIFLSDGNNEIKTPLPTEDFCGHVSTPQGKRSILKASEYVEKATVEFQLKLIKTSVMSHQDVVDCFLLGQEIGLGSNRSFEKGKFDVVSFEWEKV